MPRFSSTLDVRLQSHEFISKFIDAFRKNPCLWDITHPAYKNRSNRFYGYKRMLKLVKEIEPSATVSDVRRKIQSIRASHRKERNKVIESMKHAQSQDEVYVPALWYYDDLEFLNQKMEDTWGKNNADKISENYDNSISDNVSDTHFITVDHLKVKEYISGDENSENNENYENSDNKSTVSNLSLASTDPMKDLLESQPPSSSKIFKTDSTQITNQPSQQTSVHNEPIKEILSYIAQKIDNNRDDYDIFGKNVASELRNMTEKQRIIAKKLMNDVIFHGQLQHLTVDSQIQINSLFKES